MDSTNGIEEKTHNWGRKWTEDEDLRLLQAIEMFGIEDWRKVADHVGTRDGVKCMQRWDKVLRPDLVKGKWTEEEDNRLRYCVAEGFEHWGNIANKMPGRTAKQCRERWCNYLDPDLARGPFTVQEDEILTELQGKLGNKWAAIARHLPGRTENAVKLRFNALVKKGGVAQKIVSTTTTTQLDVELTGDNLTSVGQKRPRIDQPGGYMVNPTSSSFTAASYLQGHSMLQGANASLTSFYYGGYGDNGSGNSGVGTAAHPLMAQLVDHGIHQPHRPAEAGIAVFEASETPLEGHAYGEETEGR